MISDFRKRYLNYAELTAIFESWASAYPDITRLQSIGKTAEGRELWLLTIGSQPDETRPAVWDNASNFERVLARPQQRAGTGARLQSDRGRRNRLHSNPFPFLVKGEHKVPEHVVTH